MAKKNNHRYIQYGLLLFSISLIATGILAYVLPFSLVVTRLHIASGFTIIVLIAIHFWQKRVFFARIKNFTDSKVLITCLFAAWAVIIVAITLQVPTTDFISNMAYEGRHKREIFRPPHNAATFIHSKVLQSTRLYENNKGLALSLNLLLNKEVELAPAVAIWAESPIGTMIETLYVSPELAYSDTPTWYGKAIKRHEVLPIWRSRYSIVNGLDIHGNIDATTGATESHQFSLDKYIEGKLTEYILYVEINLPFDSDERWQDVLVGQPSVLYSAYIQHKAKKQYALLELVGHGGEKNAGGRIQYDLNEISSATNIVEFILARSEQRDSS